MTTVGIGIALERRHDRAERAGVLGLDLGEREREAGQVEVADVAVLVVRDEQLGDPGVVEDLDPVLAQVALEPRPGDVEAPVQAAGVVDLPRRPLARLGPPDSLTRNSAVTSCDGGSASACGRKNRCAEAEEPRRVPGPRAPGAWRADIGSGERGMPGSSCSDSIWCRSRRRGGALGSGSGAGTTDLAGRQVDLGPGIAQVALADAIVQVDDAMYAGIVLHVNWLNCG